MAVLRINWRGADFAEADWRPALARALDAVPRGAPVVILIHGYRYTPDGPDWRDPHRSIYAAADGIGDVAWPAGLGFSAESPADGLCIAFGWPGAVAREPGRAPFAAAYAAAEAAGEGLADLLDVMAARRPDLRADLFAHSLGARVALTATARARTTPGRLLLLGAAEFALPAQAAMAATGGVEVYNFIARQNRVFDRLFVAFAPREARRAGGGALGRSGLGRRDARWIDLQIDGRRFERWVAERGRALAPRARPVCHWSFYARDGVMALHRAILRDRERWSIAHLRAAGAPEGLELRWPVFAPAPAPAQQGRLSAA